MNVDKPQNLYRMRNLQFQTSTTCIKMLPLQNQEPVLAHPCRHLGCQKNGFDGPLQNEEPATNLEVFSTKSGHFWCTLMIFRNTGPYRVGNLA